VSDRPDTTTRLVLTGYQDSGPLHWQSLWAAKDPRFVKLAHSSWEAPDRHLWVRELEEAMPRIGPDTVIVAHSLGCLLTAFWAAETRHTVRAALLVAPPNLGRPDAPPSIMHFRDPPMRPLPFPSIVVGSDDDPYGSEDYMKGCAKAWGSRFVALKGAGHVGSMSNVGAWSEGKALLEELIAGIRSGATQPS
jgi:predicted alpha/beta hydrolase family esterase